MKLVLIANVTFARQDAPLDRHFRYRTVMLFGGWRASSHHNVRKKKEKDFQTGFEGRGDSALDPNRAQRTVRDVLTVTVSIPLPPNIHVLLNYHAQLYIHDDVVCVYES
jgi:hypothetical protein